MSGARECFSTWAAGKDDGPARETRKRRAAGEPAMHALPGHTAMQLAAPSTLALCASAHCCMEV